MFRGRSRSHIQGSLKSRRGTVYHSARGSVSTVVRTTIKVNGKGRTLAPCRPETLQPIVTKFDTRDYVMGPYNHTKFGRDPSRGFVSPYTQNIHGCSHIYYTFLWVLPIVYRQRRRSRLIRQMTWFRAKTNFRLSDRAI